jgi:hypothetical protein
MPAVILAALVTITFFVGWFNAIITAIQEESIFILVLSILSGPIASLYGLYLFF